jgi:hypothetical protein
VVTNNPFESLSVSFKPSTEIVYYEMINRELLKRLVYECRCDVRLDGRVCDRDVKGTPSIFKVICNP